MELGAIGLALVWTGALNPANPVWSEAGSWNPATAPPGAAVALEFPAEHAGFNGNDIDLSAAGPLEIRIQGSGYHIIADEAVPTCGIDAQYTSGFSRIEFDIIPHASCAGNLEYRVAGSAELRNSDNSPPAGLDLVKSGTGTLRFHSASPVTRGLTIEDGAVVIQDQWTFTSVALQGGVLAGAGRVHSIVATGGTVSPGGNVAYTGATATAGAGVGTLRTGSFSLGPGSTLQVELNGVGNSDLIDATGIVTLNNATLSATLGFTPSPHSATDVPIITNNNPPAVVGTFAGLPEGQEFMLGDRRARITYVGGSGNDVHVTILPVDDISVESTELPEITAGVPFSFQIEIAGGIPPYTCEVTGGALPAGLTLDDECLLSGTPTEPGDYSFTITVADSESAMSLGWAAMFATAEFTFSGTVAAAVPTMPAFALGALAFLLLAVAMRRGL